MFGSSSTGFGTQASAPPPTTSLFGVGGGGGGGGFGNTPNSTPATTTSFFGTTAPATTFGTTTTAPTTTGFGSTVPLFGSSNTSTTAPTGFGSTTTTVPLFGSSNTTTVTTPATNSLFGSGGLSSNKPTFGTGTSSLFNTNLQQQQQQQQPSQNLLDLDTCFSDKKMPSFIVTKDKTHSIPANFFQGQERVEASQSYENETSTLDDYTVTGDRLGSLVQRNEPLPCYLTILDNASTNTSNKSTNEISGTRKRELEESYTQNGRNVLLKSKQGVFSRQSTTFGFDRNLTRQNNHKAPTNTLQDVGMSSTVTNTTTKTETYNINTEDNSNINNNYKIQKPRTRVRVFGFNEDMVSKVLLFFESIGEQTIIYRGQWITIEYTNHEDALKAISFNGRQIEDRLIGVVWDDEHNVQVEQVIQYTTRHDLFTKTSIPTLGSLFMAKGSVEQQKTEEKRSSLFDKVKETFFGW